LPDFSLKFFAVLLVCYLIGTFPAAFILVKIFHKKDITQEGSGNVGTLNAFEVSNSKLLAFLVLLIDFIKGSAPVFFLIYFSRFNNVQIYAASVSIILGHNYNIWLKFKGGRGLAAGAGIFAAINFFMVLGWGLVWLITSLFKKGVLVSNFAATLSMPLLAVIFKDLFIKTSKPGISMNDYLYFIIFVFAVSSIIILRHIEVIKEFSFIKKNSKN
jgi:glycerol-3-phosphate acyltransferase PlsY